MPKKCFYLLGFHNKRLGEKCRIASLVDGAGSMFMKNVTNPMGRTGRELHSMLRADFIKKIEVSEKTHQEVLNRAAWLAPRLALVL